MRHSALTFIFTHHLYEPTRQRTRVQIPVEPLTFFSAKNIASYFFRLFFPIFQISSSDY